MTAESSGSETGCDAPDTLVENRWRGAAGGSGIKRMAHVTIGLAASGGCLYLVLRHVDFARMGAALRGTDKGWVLAAVGVSCVSSVIRAVRWRVLLLGAGGTAGVRVLFSSMMIGYFANNILPARMGEMVRIYMLRVLSGIRMSISAATVFIERILDALVLVTFVQILALVVVLPAIIRDGAVVLFAGFGLAALFLVYIAVRGERHVPALLHLAGKVSLRLERLLRSLLYQFIGGLGVLKSPGRLLPVMGYTLLIWLIESVSVYMVMLSMGIRLPWFAPLFVLVVLSLSFIIPSAPGAVGIYDYFAVIALSPFVADPNRAVGLALLLHGIFLLTSTLLGVGSMWMEKITFSDVINVSRYGEGEHQ